MDSDFLSQLKSATTGQTQDWLVLRKMLNSLSAPIQQAIGAAAIPHWFDARFLRFVLGEPTNLLAADFEAITRLSFVETFPDSGFNIHEHSRRLLLDFLWKTDPSRFVDLSHRSSVYCLQQNQEEPTWKIEFIYHKLTEDHTEGINLFSSQVRKWREEHLDEKAEILVRTALEVAEAGRLPSKAIEAIEIANAGVKLVYGWREPKGKNDQIIVKKFVSGEPEGVDTVNKWISLAAFPYQRRLADRWDDVMQEVRLEVTRLLQSGRFSGESSLRTYLWRIVSHTCLDQLRAQSKWKWSDVNDLEDPNSVVRRYVDQETAQLPSTGQVEKDLLVRVLSKVPQDCRELWRMVVAGLSYREMSLRTGVAEGTLRVRMLRCREKAMAARNELLNPSQAKKDAVQKNGTDDQP